MALNPIAYTEKIIRSFLRYQLTTYPFADSHLHTQMRKLLSLDETRRSPLVKGPYITLSRPFREGASVEDLIRDSIFHPHMRQRIPVEITHLFGHQEAAVRAIKAGKTTLISTGTGSGKTECFLYPVISKCLDLRDQNATSGISAVIVYPMNALAEDQLLRLRTLLAGTGVTFGMYVGKTPDKENEVTGIRLPAGSSRAEYEARLKLSRGERRGETVYPGEEICSREVMRTQGRQPRILLTNVKQLELLLTRQRDVELFDNARLDYLVFDEAHTFTGAQGAETACLIRRLRKFCGRSTQQTTCIATSATIVDKENPDSARDFAMRFFGVAKDQVVTVGESYQPVVWEGKRKSTPAPRKDKVVLLNECVHAVDADTDKEKAVRAVYRELSGEDLPMGFWEEKLSDSLSGNELVFQINELLSNPKPLSVLTGELSGKMGRPISDEEALCWLTLGSAAVKEGRPLLRPVVHLFVRGIGGAVVSFPAGKDGPELWLAAEDEIVASGETDALARFSVMSCTTCGQHYYTTALKDFKYTGTKPEGGEAAGNGSFWEPLDEAHEGCRVVLTDGIVGGAEDEDLEEHDRLTPLYFCRKCGTAHPVKGSRCLHCGVSGEMFQIFAIRQNKGSEGKLTSCLSCGSNARKYGTNYREPARTVRATNVADVHVLAQDMVHHSERPRLLVFCDNRQDAAFQAGWMKDHARRFRLRGLMFEGLSKGLISIGDLTLFLDDRLDKDDSLSRALVPEVWQVVRKEGSGGRHQQERQKFLRIQVLREMTISSRQAIGLEPWGRMKVDYEGLNTTLPWIQLNAKKLGMPAEDLCEGIASILDYMRRKRILYDPMREIFTKYWMDGDLEVEQGYIPQLGNPIGTKLNRDPSDDPKYVSQWQSEKGSTVYRQIVLKWGVSPENATALIDELFAFLVERQLLKGVVLKGSRGNALPHVSGVYQVNADALRMGENHGVWRCNSCRRRSPRRTPQMKCTSWRCAGTLEFVTEDPDNYDLQLLDQRYSLIKPEEHTAMVPHDERERLENLFKSDSEAVDTFVCTQTLELGVDIGQLDAVLMRNVPPLPANYWQRAGRAGRRHRMAVVLSYCRPVSHDQAYFKEPMKILTGRVDPPAFNLRNDLMVAKHVRASVLSRVHQYMRDPKRTSGEQISILETLKTTLPDRVTPYLFEGQNIRAEVFDFGSLDGLIKQNRDDLLAYVTDVFQQGWPEMDQEVTKREVLQSHIEKMVPTLSDVVDRLRRRLKWAMGQITRLNAVREKQGTLEPEDEAIFRRCDRLVKRLKGSERRARREAEGYDDVNLYGVLAAEGYLPGYGLEVGSILGSAEIPFWRTGAMDFTLPRPPSVALREYVPGNLIYANGNRFVARRFHRDADEQKSEMPNFEVSIERKAIKETSLAADASALGTSVLPAISVCDVDLVHRSQISDDEETRFQMGVSVCGIERGQHNGGKQYRWGSQTLQHRKGLRLRLVNVGARRVIEGPGRLGYPVCAVCGDSRSPMSSDRERDLFITSHEERCGRKPAPIGFFADVVADALTLQGCADQTTAYSVMEAIRIAATDVLDMHREDLQILVIGHVEHDQVDGYLWDPMPGGSGLLDQICERFEEIAKAAQELVEQCPGVCAHSCIDCLQTFRNSFYHEHLDRNTAAESITGWGSRLAYSHDIPPLQPTQEAREGTYPVNASEEKLRRLLLAAGFDEGLRGQQLRLERSIGTTTPDVIYRAGHHSHEEGICIYLDGMSEHIHGNSGTAEQDRLIRTWLRNNGYEVIEITASELDDVGAMARHFRKLAGYLGNNDLREQLKTDSSWFETSVVAMTSTAGWTPKIVNPKRGEKYVNCVPLVPLNVAAGGFSDQQDSAEGSWEWVEVVGHRLKKGMFVTRVVGKSMEPFIPDGSYCLFSAPITGTRQGKVVLVMHSDISDPDTGGSFTVKRYKSEKTPGELWEHSMIQLVPDNSDFQPIILKGVSEDDFKVIAEFVSVLN